MRVARVCVARLMEMMGLRLGVKESEMRGRRQSKKATRPMSSNPSRAAWTNASVNSKSLRCVFILRRDQLILCISIRLS